MKRALGSDSPKNQCEGSGSSQYESAEQKAERNRERNREHAKKTRLRKKEMIEGMKIRLLELQRESARLEQLIEESNTASILLCLGGKQDSSSTDSPVSSITNSPICVSRLPDDSSSAKRRRKGSDQEESSPVGVSSEGKDSELGVPMSLMKGNIIDQLRQKVRVEASKNFNKDQYIFSTSNSTSQMMEEGDEDDDSSVEPNNKPVSSSSSSTHSDEVDNEVQNRRARNRMHAKLTRDRKKLFTNKMQETILLLESRNQQLRCQLDQLLKSSATPPPVAVAPFPPGSFSMPTLYGNLPLEQKLQGAYDPLTAFCYFAEIWNQAFEAKKPSSATKSIPSY
eukprot:gene14610-16192_t